MILIPSHTCIFQLTADLYPISKGQKRLIEEIYISPKGNSMTQIILWSRMHVTCTEWMLYLMDKNSFISTHLLKTCLQAHEQLVLLASPSGTCHSWSHTVSFEDLLNTLRQSTLLRVWGMQSHSHQVMRMNSLFQSSDNNPHQWVSKIR